MYLCTSVDYKSLMSKHIYICYIYIIIIIHMFDLDLDLERGKIFDNFPTVCSFDLDLH
mgnify:FL=1